MPNKFKHNHDGTATNSIFKGNWAINLTSHNTGEGPSGDTGFYTGLSIPTGGYAIYSPEQSFTAKNDEQLLGHIGDLGGDNMTVPEALTWASTQDDILILDKTQHSVLGDNIALNLDPSSLTSFHDNIPTTNLVPLDLSDPLWFPEYSGGRKLKLETLFGYPVYEFKSNPGQVWISPFSFNSYDRADNDLTLSVYAKNIGASTVSFNTYFGKDYSTDSLGASNTKSIPADNTWRRYSWTLAGGTMNSNYLEFRTAHDNVLISCPQLEVGRIATPIVDGTRTQTAIVRDTSTRAQNCSMRNGVGYNNAGYFEFDGVDDFIQTATEPGVSSSDGFSIELLIKSADTGSPMVITPLSGGIDHFVRMHGNGRIYLSVIPGADSSVQSFETQSSLHDGKFHHVLFTYKQSEGGKAYFDGELEGAGGSNFTAIDWSAYWVIGQRGNNTYFFDGGLATIKAYSKALTHVEVLRNYYKSNIVTDSLTFAIDAGNLASYLPEGLEALNINSLANDSVCTLVNGATHHNGDFSYWEFDGVNDHITMPTYTFGNGNWAMSMWVNTDSSYYNLMSNSSGGPVTNAFGYRNEKMFYQNYSNPWEEHEGNTVISRGNWHMLTWVNYSDNTMEMFVDGNLDSDRFPSFTTNGGPCNIIGGFWGSDKFKGKIAKVLIYDKALTLEEIQQNYNADAIKLPYTVQTDGDYLKVFRHNTANGQFFSSANGWAEARRTKQNSPHGDKYSILDNVEDYLLEDKYTFKLVYPNEGITNIWSQTNNPVTDDGSGGVTGYEPISIQASGNGWGGLERYDAQGSTFLDGTLSPISNWYYAIGSKLWQGGGIPGATDGPTQLVELWIKYK